MCIEDFGSHVTLCAGQHGSKKRNEQKGNLKWNRASRSLNSSWKPLAFDEFWAFFAFTYYILYPHFSLKPIPILTFFVFLMPLICVFFQLVRACQEQGTRKFVVAKKLTAAAVGLRKPSAWRYFFSSVSVGTCGSDMGLPSKKGLACFSRYLYGIKSSTGMRL